MAEHNDELVKVASGTLIEVQSWAGVLRDAGIEARVVGDNLTAGLGTALMDSVELWVDQPHAEKAAKLIAADEAKIAHHHGHQAATHPIPAQGHPVSDPKPDHSRGPTHGAPPHRPVS